MQFVKVFAQLGDPKRAPYPVVVTQRVVNPSVAQCLGARCLQYHGSQFIFYHPS